MSGWRRWLFVLIATVLPSGVLAVSSAHYQLPEYDFPQGASGLNSTRYRLNGSVSSLEGLSMDPAYRLAVGFPAITGGSISLSLDSSAVDVGTMNPEKPVSGTTTVTVITDSPSGYQLLLEKTQLFTHSNGSTTLADVAFSVASPAAWSAPGFGFTVSSGTNLETKWGSGTNFAALPTLTPTSVHAVAQSISAPDATTVRY